MVLGPFQGRPACVRIAFGRGVVGTAAEKRTTIRVADVNQFPGHIACDTASKSEIVVPLTSDDSHLLGVLDVEQRYLLRSDAAKDLFQFFDLNVGRVVETRFSFVGALPRCQGHPAHVRKLVLPVLIVAVGIQETCRIKEFADARYRRRQKLDLRVQYLIGFPACEPKLSRAVGA